MSSLYAQDNKKPISDSTSFTENQDSLIVQKIDEAIIDSLQFEEVIDTLRFIPSKNELDDQVDYSARDSIRFDLPNKKVYLYGGAVVDYGDIKLSAGKISFDFSNKTVIANGILDSTGLLTEIPEFSDGDQTFYSDEIQYNFDSEKGKIKKLITQEGEGILVGEVVKKTENNDLYAANAYYTTCNLEHPHFRIQSKKIKVVPNKVVVTGPANLQIGEIPTPFFLPFGIFPLQEDRASGIIMPSYGESNDQGFFLKNGGVYLALGKYLDVALRGEIYTRGRWGVTAATQYKKKYKFGGQFSVSYGKTPFGDEITNDFSEQKDFRIVWNHSQDPKARPNSSFSANVNIASASFNTNYFSTSENFLSNTLSSSIAYSMRFPNSPFSFSASARHSQNTQTNKVNVTLPDIAFNMSRINPFERKRQIGEKKWYENIGVSYSLNTKNDLSGIDSTFFTNETYNSSRKGIKQSASASTNFKVLKYFNFTPSVSVTDRIYFDEIKKHYIDQFYIYDNEGNRIDTLEQHLIAEEKIEKFSSPFDFSVNTGLGTILYGVKQFKKGPVTAIRHVFRPSISLSYRPDMEQIVGDYYRDLEYYNGNTEQLDTLSYSIYENGVYGSPPASGKSMTINFSIDNNLEMKVRSKNDTSDVQDKKIKILESFRISSGYSVYADEFNWNNLRLTARNNLFNKINLNFDATYDPYGVDTLGERINQFSYDLNQGLLRFKSANVSIGGNFSSQSNSKTDKQSQLDKGQEDLIGEDVEYIDFDIPWSIGINYRLGLAKNYLDYFETEVDILQTLNFNANFNLTPKWKIDLSTGWDFVNNEISYTSINILRDLHCWDMRFNWIPKGRARQYEFTIRATASMLQDLRLRRKRNNIDF